MTFNPDTAPIDEVRDWLRDELWTIGLPDDPYSCGVWVRKDGTPGHWNTTHHPYPPTLDGAASAMPAGWTVCCTPRFWDAFCNRPHFLVQVHRTACEIEDRYRLAAKAVQAEKGNA